MKPVSLYMLKDSKKLCWFPHQRTMYEAFVETVKPDETVRVSFRIEKAGKSNPQLGYWYAVLLPFARDAFIEAGHDTIFDSSACGLSVGIATTTDTVDLLFKTLFKEHAGLTALPKKRDMDVSEMSKLIDFALKWLAENLGAFAPVPRD